MALNSQAWMDDIYTKIKEALNAEIAAGKRLDGFTIYEKLYQKPRDYKYPHIIIPIMEFMKTDVSVTDVDYYLTMKLIIGDRGYEANLKDFRDKILNVKDIIDEQRNNGLGGLVKDISVNVGRIIPPVTEREYMYYFYELEVSIIKEVTE